MTSVANDNAGVVTIPLEEHRSRFAFICDMRGRNSEVAVSLFLPFGPGIMLYRLAMMSPCRECIDMANALGTMATVPSVTGIYPQPPRPKPRRRFEVVNR